MKKTNKKETKVIDAYDYENSLNKQKRKSEGIYYTPNEIIDYILDKTISRHNIIENPYLKVLDISCGCGNFLLRAYDYLYNMFYDNIDELKKRYGEDFKEENIYNHIVQNCLYGYDTDKDAIDILKFNLMLKQKENNINHNSQNLLDYNITNHKSQYNLSQHIHKENSQDIYKNITQNDYEENLQDIYKNITQNDYEENSQDIYKNIAQNDYEENSQDIYKNIIQEDCEKIKQLKNFIVTDSLKYDPNIKFDYIVGNPPYVSHKNLDLDYKKYLMKNFSDVYVDKSDLYFCFIKRILDFLKEDGLASIIVPRYFLESISATRLRNFLTTNSDIHEIVDFFGQLVFKNVGVSSCILTYSHIKNEQIKNINSDIQKNNNEIKIKNNGIKDTIIYRAKEKESIEFTDQSLKEKINSAEFQKCILKVDEQNKEWLILDRESEIIYNKIIQKCDYILEEIVDSFQGIITGCDKAFIYNKDDDRIKSIKEKYIKKWIKNKNVDKYIIHESNLRLVYSDDMTDDDNAYFQKIIKEYEGKLKNRRECKNGIRKWFELQWGRESSLFETKKIMYRYKSNSNKFAIDYEQNFSSADVYSFTIKEKFKNEFSYEYLVALLNSDVYDRYYKINAKKMNKNVYDYYPNKVLKMKIFKDENYTEIEELSKQIISYLKKNESTNKNDDINKIQELQNKINKLVEKSIDFI
ncbi:MAG: Eco57I restriction-modification methylase domain-containing protein [Clostridioides sp.]|jgi:SAM-dependent methyltransferase|nr:Eco57I restriction-modification methylase domain-containing protein [Clostridioides sp.]